MAQRSFWWTTGGVGDGEFEYTRDDWQQYVKIQAACHGEEGIAAGGLAATGATNQVTIGAGMAIVDGKPYINDDNVVVTIPSAVGGGNTRIDRIVLRANWDDMDVDEGQRVRLHLIPGTDAGSPAAPAVASTSQDLYDVKGWQVLVDTDGAITLTDERELAVITTAELADEAVTDMQAGARVARLRRRQGGSATDWTAQGFTDYTPERLLEQIGAVRVTIGNGESVGTVIVTYPIAYSHKPHAMLTLGGNQDYAMYAFAEPGASTMNVKVWRSDNMFTHTVDVFWRVVGEQP